MGHFLPEEDHVGSDAEHHSDDAVAHQAEVPPPPPLPLLCRRLLSMSLSKLLPVAHALLGFRTDGEAVGGGGTGGANVRNRQNRSVNEAILTVINKSISIKL